MFKSTFIIRSSKLKLQRQWIALERYLSRNKVFNFSNSTENSSTSSSSSSSSDDENEKAEKRKQSLKAREKLNSLLHSMIQDNPVKTQSKLELAKPKGRLSIKTESHVESVNNESDTKRVEKAIKDVAESIGGDIKQTESELLQKLLASTKRETPISNLSDIFKDMKIDRESKAGEDVSRAHQVRQLLETVKAKGTLTKQTVGPRKVFQPRSESNYIEERVDLFGSPPLGIFPSKEEVDKWPEVKLNETWKDLYSRELRLAVIHPPANYFQEMILWTKQGKLWRFPIDNEQDLDEEKNVCFTEHIFLEKHLESWCPSKGPIRHFMELVCVGLSKNHYLTVEKKKEHIEWFKDYFNEKQGLLQEVGAVPPGFDFEKNNTKEIGEK